MLPLDPTALIRWRQADRDDKIRVSRYPRGWNIIGYCLGHLEFISSVCIVGDWYISTSGDGTVRLWDAATCALLATAVPSNDIEGEHSSVLRVAVACPTSSVIAVVVDDCPDLVLYSIMESELSFCGTVQPSGQAVTSAVFAIDGSLWVSDVDGGVFRFVFDAGKFVSTPFLGPLAGRCLCRTQ